MHAEIIHTRYLGKLCVYVYVMQNKSDLLLVVVNKLMPEKFPRRFDIHSMRLIERKVRIYSKPSKHNAINCSRQPQRAVMERTQRF